MAIHNGNKILTRFSNYGAIADWRNSPGRYDCGIYPIGSGRSYLAEFSPIVAAEVDNTRGGGKINILSEGMPASSIDLPSSGDYLWQFEPRLGYANSNDSLIAMSDDTLSWPLSWVDLPDDWDNAWAGQYGKYSRADQESYFHLDDFNNDEFSHYPMLLDDNLHTGEIIPFMAGDSGAYAMLLDANTSFEDLVRDVNRSDALDVRSGRRPDVIKVSGDKWYEIDSLISDHTLRLKTFIGNANQSPTGTEYQIYDGLKRGLGVDVSVRGYQWAHPAAEDILIFTYWIKNMSSLDYQKFVFGMYGDADVGDDGDQYDDDAWFETANDIVYQWDHNMWSVLNGGYVPAYFGWKYLESPGNPLDDIDNDEDGMIDERQDDGIDNDGDWNPYVDDIGADGVGPNYGEYTGPDADGTEGNGVPDLGEPNFEYTDNDESDQIGLTSFTAARYPGIDLTRDGVTWGQLAPGSFTNISQTVDITFMYGSAYFPLPQEEDRKFAVALIFGNDYEDILRNSETMQQIYNSDYNFAKPPNLPKLTAVPGDGQVTLYWDDKAEYSMDPIYGHDFEGYRIYRATDPAFNEVWTITDTYGNQTFNKPIAQFDLADGLTGPHPYGLNGIHLDMGTDTGLRHSWTDTDVENGQTYYYAVVAYDYGYDYDFYERGISDVDLRPPITPSECTKKIEINASGDAINFDINTAMVVPNAPAMAYIAPEIVADNTTTLGTGTLEISVIDPSSIRNGDQYEITFRDWSEDEIDNDGDWRTWTDDTTHIDLNPTLEVLIPPNSDTLIVNLGGGHVIQGITQTTTQFLFSGYYYITTQVDTETVSSQDTTYLRYFVDIPDTSFTLLPTLGIWDGWEPIYSDVGADGCDDAWETGDPDNPCSETALNLGNDPNQDNWNPSTNPDGTQANAIPDIGEPNIDANDIDEISQLTSSFQLKNLTTGDVLLSDQTDLSGEGRGMVTEGFRINLENDEIVLLEAESGWTTSGLNFDINITQEKYNTVDFIPVPFDYLLTIDPVVTDTSINNKATAFHLEDLTNDLPVDFIYTTAVTDTIIRPGAVIYPIVTAGGDMRVTWKLVTDAKVGDVSFIAEWNDLVAFATANHGLGVFDGETWSNITTEEGLLSNNIRNLNYDNSGRLLVGTSNGLNVHTDLGWLDYAIDLIILDANPDEVKTDFLVFNQVLEDSEGILWSISLKGLMRWDWHRSDVGEILSENAITYVDFVADTFKTVSGDTILTGIIQNESLALADLGGGAIVVGTKSEGLEFYNPSDSSFWYLNKDNSELPTDKILALQVVGDSLYIGTKDKGLVIYDLVDSAFVYSNKDSLLNRKVEHVMVAADGRIHLSTKDGYNIVDLDAAPGSQYIAYTKEDVPEFGTNKIKTVAEMADGTIWIGTENSVARNQNQQWEDWAPTPGDQFIIKSRKPFSAKDVLAFNAVGGDVDVNAPVSLLKNIAVVPNPYVVTASWEPQHLYDSGRGIRKIDFIHLPPECTIKIYTISGKYINTLEHNSDIWDGVESWNLLSRDGLEIAYGVYLFHIDAPDVGSIVGKFAVIK
ncbi:MAG: hypothetical protein U9Q77_08540 [Candidatus Marinimicrobia bacterium]|nr:hypothetical protein [Candidatus Neomarinimicrobiota bacterium]